MTDKVSDNKRIVKNTLLLYLRMLLLLAVSLYTSRIVLATLGIKDYGLYNVVGGIVAMFSFLSVAMGNSTSRFITFALGKKDTNKLKEVVSTAIYIHRRLAIIIFLLAETLGLWFLLKKMVIPDGRMAAAIWVYQFSIITCVVSIISVPYNSMIIAHEKMGAFAFISILDAILKLIIVYLIQVSPYDKLIFYALLLCIISIIDRLIYQIYCKRHFEEASNIYYKKTGLFKEMSSFAGWSLMGNLAYVAYTHGINILLNIFFGTSVNAARGIAVQLQTALNSFVTNFQLAVNPQITKSYAANDKKRTLDLLFLTSKFSFFLMFFFSLPVFIEAPNILNIWLVDVPEHTVAFIRLLILIMLVQTLHNPVSMIKSATGIIKNYQIIIGGILLLILPLSFIALKMGAPAEIVFVVHLLIQIIAQLSAVLLVKHDIGMTFLYYFKNVILRILPVALFASVIPVACHFMLPKDTFSVIIVIIISFLAVLTSVLMLGLNKSERSLVLKKICNFIKKHD